MENRLTPELVSMAVEGGMLDDSLDALREVMRARRETLDMRAAAALNPGDEFLIKDCSPKKWNGERVRFVKRDGMWLVVNPTHSPSKTIRLRNCHVGTIMHKAV